MIGGGLLVATELPARWYPLRPVAAQLAYVQSPHRFNIVPAGRRGGKTERAKRKIVRVALSGERVTHNQPARYFAAAPTRDQAKRIFWDDLKELSVRWWMEEPSESQLTITLLNGTQIVVVGMDRPERIEGSPWDGGVLDEYANMKATAWTRNVRPALSDRRGWCDLIGVPEGRNHYYDLWNKARAEQDEKGDTSEWGAYTWTSADVLPADEIEAAKGDLDSLTYEQEYEANFVNFAGRAYYAFGDANKAAMRKKYDPRQPLVVCLDFNVAPGVAAIIQELPFPGGLVGTAIIGEVWIENNSNTVAVCRRILKDWGDHEGRVEVFGDATGGARGSAKVQGSDWDLAKQTLRAGDGEWRGFGGRVSFSYKSQNPAERARVNAVNTRCRAGDGTIRLLCDGKAAPHVLRDFEGVVLLEGGSGEIDKHKDGRLTHLTDGIGYYLEFRYPVTERDRWGSHTYATKG